MNERRDDTTKTEAESRRAPGSYYYDDATGYELFDPDGDDEADGEAADEKEGDGGAA